MFFYRLSSFKGFKGGRTNVDRVDLKVPLFTPQSKLQIVMLQKYNSRPKILFFNGIKKFV